jgi:hypothetical protein
MPHDPDPRGGDAMNFTDLAEVFQLHPSPLDKDWLDGPRLAAWIKAHHTDLFAQLGNGKEMKNLEAWERGQPAQLRNADRVLCRLGSHIHELDPALWIDKPKRRPRRRPEEMPERIAA